MSLVLGKRAPAPLIGLAVIGLALLIGPPGAAGATGTARRLGTVAAFYPLAEVLHRVGRAVTVTNLTPAGAEPHDLELTPSQVDAIQDADLAVVMGKGFQPAVERVAARRDGATLEIRRSLAGAESAGKRAAAAGKDDAPNALDPHVWLDPTRMVAVVDAVRQALGKVDPAGTAAFARNAATYSAELAQLDEQFRTGLSACDRHLIVTSHEAFGYLAARYGLRQEGISGLSPDAEPGPKRLAQLADLARSQGVTTIFTEELVSPKVAETLAREAGGLKTAVLNPLEGLTGAEVRGGADYVSVMQKNLRLLRDGLGCR